MNGKMKLKIAGVILLALILLVGGIYVIALKNGATENEKKESKKEQITQTQTKPADVPEAESEDETDDTETAVEESATQQAEASEDTNAQTEQTEQTNEEKIVTVNYLPESVTSTINVDKLQREIGTWLTENGMAEITSMSYTDEEAMDTAHNSKTIILLADGTVRYVMCTYSVNDDSYIFMEM